MVGCKLVRHLVVKDRMQAELHKEEISARKANE
jgi:hypothetical protein